MTRHVPVALLLLLAACGDELDHSALEPVGDYTTWHRVDAVGPLAAHGDTYRILYANEAARSWPGAGAYPVGTVIVKEIRSLDADGGPGEIDYLAIARRLDEPPAGGALEGDWLWTFASDRDAVGTGESLFDGCWDSCHVAAPFAGLFHDFGR